MNDFESAPRVNRARMRTVQVPSALLHRALAEFFLAKPSVLIGNTNPEAGPLVQPKYQPESMGTTAVKAMLKVGLDPLHDPILHQSLVITAKERIGGDLYAQVMAERKRIAREQNLKLARGELTPEE